MMNIFEHMVERYNEVSYTHNYIYGFSYADAVYMVHTDATMMPYILKLDKASRGAGYALRFCPNTAQKTLLMSKGAEILCSAAYFNQIVAESKYNRGEIFEKLVTERYGQKWEKDKIPFTEAGDIEVDGTAYQIKFEKATFTNEKTLANL